MSMHEIQSGLNSFSSQSNTIASHEYKSDVFLRIAMSILPIMAVLTYQMDAIWQLHLRNMYAGLSSTILHIFYFLQFYTHLKCRSSRITCIYTYLYHIVIWIFKVGIDRWGKMTMTSDVFRLEGTWCISSIIIEKRIDFINVYSLYVLSKIQSSSVASVSTKFVFTLH